MSQIKNFSGRVVLCQDGTFLVCEQKNEVVRHDEPQIQFFQLPPINVSLKKGAFSVIKDTRVRFLMLLSVVGVITKSS